MKYLVIIIILFLFIFYYNIILSQKDLVIKAREKKYSELKKRISENKKIQKITKDNESKKKNKKDKKVDFIIDNIEQNSMIDSIFSDGTYGEKEIIKDLDSFNGGESFALGSLEL